ncbi:hypothetical protein ASPZODRAFT_58906, partial [Penicilliopsis zonata CBS 506.65]
STAVITGIELSMSGSMVGSQAFCKVMGNWVEASDAYVVPAGHVSAWTAAATPAQFVGIYLAGFISDRYGRKYVVQGSMVIIFVGAIIETFSRNWIDWLVSKAVMGLAIGTIQSSTSTYVAEISPRELRGGALIGFQVFTNIGNLLSAVILDLCTKAITDPADTKQYKIPLYIMIALPVILSIGIFTMLVESPSWLVVKDDLAGARKSIQWIYPYMTPEEVEVELAKIRYTVEKECEQAEASVSWLMCFRGTNFRRTIVALVPGVAWIMSGYIMLCADFFDLAGQENALQSTVIVQCTGLFFNLVAVALVENKRVGRFLIYMIGLFFQAGGMLMIGAVGARWGNPGGSTLAGNLLIAGLVISNMGSQLGPQAVSYLYTSESGSTLLRAKTTSVSQSIIAVLGQTSGVYLPFMLSSWGPKTGFFFGGFGFFFWIISFFVVPDYTGRSHAQIDELFTRKISARKFASTECTGNYGRDVLHETEMH